MLHLAFETSDPHVDARGAQRYVLYQDHDQYRLPDVVLLTDAGTATVPVQEAGIFEIAGGGRAALALREEIKAAWDNANLAGIEHIAARRVLTSDRAVSADAVEPARAEAGEPVQLQVTWRYSYTDAMGLQATGVRTARLEFAPHGERPRRGQRMLDADAEREGVPAPIRNVGARKPYPNFAAADFGTSASTVTLFDTRSNLIYPVDPGQAQRLREEFAGLITSDVPGEHAAEWRKLRDAVLAEVSKAQPGLAAGDAAGLADRLRAQSPAIDGQPDHLLDLVCVAVEHRFADAQEALRQWLAPQLLRCYDHAFAVPPLAVLKLRPVRLDDRQFEVPTAVSIAGKSPVKIKFDTTSGGTLRDLKSKLSDAEPLDDGYEGEDGKDATTDDLIALVYRELIERTETFLRDKDDDPEEAITELVVTFPTTTPPRTRQHLERMIHRTLDVAVPRVLYDEGVAAALYFLMRDFGGNRPELGAEALRARARQVSADPPAWRQNMLVLDIGAGTTDIALLRLTLVDDTRPIDGVNEAVQGRYYVIRPEVINSTGHPQLGGNYLTLRVFYWLKAAIVDALVTGQQDELERRKLTNRIRLVLGLENDADLPQFAQLVARSGIEAPVPAEVAPALRAALPTHFDAGSAKEQPFTLLWDIAEDAKIALGGELPEGHKEYIVEKDRIVPVLTAIGIDTVRALDPLIPAGGVKLDQGDFETLARPVLAHAAELGRWIVQQSLGKPEDKHEDERLDRVMLSGKTSIMRMAKEVIAEELSAIAGEVPWNPAAISVESQYAKQAASIGAAWAHSSYGYLAGQASVADQLTMGRSVLSFDVDNVFHSLPCQFDLMRPQNRTSTLLEPGTPLVEVDREGRLAARQEWTAADSWPTLVPAFEVHRPIRLGKTQIWGTYHFQRNAKLEPGFTPDPRIWLADATGHGAKVHAQLEIDERLAPMLYLSQGRPHFHIDPASCQELRGRLPAGCWNAAEFRLSMLSASVVVIGLAGDDYPEGTHELFPLWLPKPGEPAFEYFPDYFHEHLGMDSVPVAGRLAAMPPPPADGEYLLVLRAPGMPDQDLPPIRVPSRDPRTARYTATLDACGRLAVHRGRPPYWQAGTLRDVEDHAGAVLRREMQPGRSVRDPAWDPFTGKH